MRTLLITIGMLLAVSTIAVAQEKQPHWVVIADVSLPNHKPIPYMEQSFKSEEECKAFLQTSKFKQSLENLRDYELASHADEPDFEVTAECYEAK